MSGTAYDFALGRQGSFEFRIRATYADSVAAVSQVAPLDVGTCSAAVGVPSNFTAIVTGLIANVAWRAPSEGCPAAAYQLGVGSRDGRSDIALVTLPGTALGSEAPPGNYYVSVRALHGERAGDWSEHRLLTIGVPPPPEAPTALSATAQGGVVSIAWVAPTSGSPVVGYILEAGSSAGLSDLAELALGTTTSLSAGGVPPGRYFIRVRAVGTHGVGLATEEIVVVVN